VAGAQITVVSDSIAIRECIDIALARRHHLSHVDINALSAQVDAFANAELVICDADLIAPALQRAPRILRVLSRLAPTAPAPYIAYPFRPEQLRLAVDRVLATPPSHTQMPHEPAVALPWLPPAAARLAAAAVRCRLPVLLCGESGVGKRRLAQHIHLESGGGPLLTVASARLGDLPEVRRASCATLLLTDIDALDATGAVALDEFLEATSDDSRAPRLIATTTLDPDVLATLPALATGRFDRLAVLPITLPPLRERVTDLAVIAADVITAAARRAGIAPAPSLTRAAIARLERYPWPGNLHELEAVLARSFALQSKLEIDVGDLAFDVADVAPLPSSRASTAATNHEPQPSTSESTTELVMLLQELAHELKNPMVAVKAAAQHLGRNGGNDASRDDAARLAGDAVDRMDQVVENMLQFGNFGSPCPEAIRIADLVAPALDAVDSELDVRQIHLDDRTETDAIVWVDPPQATYAVENILRAALRAAGDGAPLCLRSQSSGPALVIEFPANTGSVAAKLAKWSNDSLLGPAIEPSIRLVFARSLLERNGGHIDIANVNGTTRVHIDLPRHRGEVEEAGGG